MDGSGRRLNVGAALVLSAVANPCDSMAGPLHPVGSREAGAGRQASTPSTPGTPGTPSGARRSLRILSGMAYDEHLAARIRALLAQEPTLTERAMFGGLGFMIGGHMAVAAGSGGDLLVRVDPARSQALLGAGVDRMVMRGKQMAGWLHADEEAVATDEGLARIVGWGVAYVRTLPPK